MKAIAYHNYGSPDDLTFEEIEKPAAGDEQVLIKVRAVSVNPLDWHYMRGEPYFLRMMAGLRKPTITKLGVDVAGQVEAVGAKVTRFKPGDEVFGSCRGAFAEFVSASESALVSKPDNITFEQAASAPVAALTALLGLRDKGRVQPGQKVLINGAAGGVGTFAVQIAKWLGAEVTGVCSTRNVELVRSLGADHVIDYTREDCTRPGQRYDIFFHCAGSQSLLDCRRVLTSRGKYILVGAPSGRWLAPMDRLFTMLVLSPFVSQKFLMLLTNPKKEDLIVIADLMQAGKVKPVVDNRRGLSEVPAAIRYLEEGHARGKVVITLDH
jgi:NADPH:quinone reductase-like Zn-dependent oxidoreductase